MGHVTGSSASTGAPLPPTANYGNFSHRQVHATGLSGSAASGGKITSKKEILKNLRKLKTNAGVEDYYVMQNISNQMGGKLVSGTGTSASGNKAENFLSITNPLHVVNMNQTTSGLNTTKHNKTEKSFENLMTAFTTKKGGANATFKQVQVPSMGTLKSGKQLSHDSKGRLSKNNATDVSNHRNMSVASGGTAGTGGRQHKNLSNSPKARVSHNQEIKRLLSSAIASTTGQGVAGGGGSTISQKAGRGQKSSQGKQSTALSFSGQPVHRAQAKTHRGGVPAGYTNLVAPYASTGAAGSSHGMVPTGHNYQKPLIPNSSKRHENMKDLNYLIKTMEKFSKKKA